MLERIYWGLYVSLMSALLFARFKNFLQDRWVALHALTAIFGFAKFEVNRIMNVNFHRILFANILWQPLVKLRFLLSLGILNRVELI